MIRRAHLAMGLLAVSCWVADASAQTALLVSGSSTILTVDTNENGVLTDPEDCKFTATFTPDMPMSTTGSITIVADQTPVPPFDTILANCLETWVGPAAFDPTGSASVSLTDTLGSITQTFSFSGTPVGGTGPVEIQSGEGRLGASLLGTGFFCNVGGPAIRPICAAAAYRSTSSSAPSRSTPPASPSSRVDSSPLLLPPTPITRLRRSILPTSRRAPAVGRHGKRPRR
jgi:hypothetical protein